MAKIGISTNPWAQKNRHGLRGGFASGSPCRLFHFFFLPALIGEYDHEHIDREPEGRCNWNGSKASLQLRDAWIRRKVYGTKVTDMKA